MAKTTLATVATVGDLITGLLSQLVTDGWTQVGATGVYTSFVDSDGRAVYIKVFEDTVGNLMVSIAPILNDAGTDLPTDKTKKTYGCNFIAGQTWDLYSTSKSFFLATGNAGNATRVWCGRYDTLANVSAVVMPWLGFISGCREEDSATAYAPRLLIAYQTYFFACSLQDLSWTTCNMAFPNQANTSTGSYTWQVAGDYLDGRLLSMRPLLSLTPLGGDLLESWGTIGVLPDVLIVMKFSALVVGDTVELDDGTIYEFREKTIYWDYYANSHLLWRIN